MPITRVTSQDVKNSEIVNEDIANNAAIDPSKIQLNDGNLLIGNGSNQAAPVTISGDVTIDSAGTSTLSNSGVIAGTYSNAIITVDVNGRITAALDGTAESSSSYWVNNEIPAGTINGVNDQFSLQYIPVSGSSHVYKNGLRLTPGQNYDFTVSSNVITFASGSIPETNDMLLADYQTNGEQANLNTFTSSGTWTCPSGVTEATVQCWGGGGGNGGFSSDINGDPYYIGGSGGGGAYSKSIVSTTPGNDYDIQVGIGGTYFQTGGDTWFGSSSTVMAKGGNPGSQFSGYQGGSGGSAGSGVGTVKYSGGDGGQGGITTYKGGGSSAGSESNGNPPSGTTGGAAPINGGAGGDANNSGETPGGGAGGGNTAARGAPGQVIITW